MHFHRKLSMWLPPGGHIEQGELPDNAAVREVLEETGLEVELVGERREDVEDPVQLHRPAGVQLENIEPGHQHIDLIYFARPTGSTEIAESYSEDRVGWYGPEDWGKMAVNAEVRGRCRAESAIASAINIGTARRVEDVGLLLLYEHRSRVRAFLSSLTAPETLPTPVGEPAAVHRESMAVDVAALLWGGEKRHRLRYILRPCEAPHRGAAFYVRICIAT